LTSKDAAKIMSINTKMEEMNRIDEIIVDDKRRHSNELLKRKENLKKIRESARQGNIISKKLLL
jgi:hypothetical protein